MVLDRNPDNFFAETEQAAFGTGMLVDGIDFSDDKMLQGRTLSYPDTQRYRVGPNYLQLPINAPQQAAPARTNQRDGQMTYRIDDGGGNRHIHYSNLGDDLRQCPAPIALRMAWHFWHCDEDYSRRVAAAAGIDLDQARALAPLPGKAMPGR